MFYELERADTNMEMTKKKREMPTDAETHIFVQTALLYTSSEGERRIRVHNLAMPITDTVSEPFENMGKLLLHFCRLRNLSNI